MELILKKTSSKDFVIVSGLDEQKAQRLKTGEQYTFNVKHIRNPAFHRKVFSFFNFCFGYWTKGHELQNEQKQFDEFRKELTIMAGFCHQVFAIDGKTFKLAADSLSYSNMTQDEFENCYDALINAAIKYVFYDSDEVTYNTLLEFF